MRTLLLIATIGLGLLMAMPAEAQPDRRNDRDHRSTQWRCQHGDQQACRVLRLSRSCDRGDRRACRQLHGGPARPDPRRW